MHIQGLSESSLKDLHALIQEALEIDDAALRGAEAYGVREYANWKRQADAFEGEMDRRHMQHTKINWELKSGHKL